MMSSVIVSSFLSTALLLCIGTVANAMDPETFKIPAEQSVIEIVRGSLATVSFGVQYIPDNTQIQYQLRLVYQSSTFEPGTRHNKEHLFTLEVNACPSEQDTRCRVMDIRLRGSPELDGMDISLALYVFRPHEFPQLDTETELQQFTIRIVDPPTTSKPTTPPVPDTSTTASTSEDEPSPQVGVSATTGSTLIGALLGAAFLVSFIGNIVFLVLWCRARSPSNKSVPCDSEAQNVSQTSSTEMTTPQATPYVTYKDPVGRESSSPP